ncbi:hypothetical protein LR48_Vigan08g022200 [Vigna angularis]|uniref:Uncharacterized protein n=1 Tax=Phaseolus angularis TaxID=3914 RepID=A0A0L9V2S1_PHAAN|nr:hypothetical protein LR48_Vigan08g022200 [Vigna angularis]
MANSSVKRRFHDDYAAGFDVVLDEIGVQTDFVVNVIECVSEIRGDLHSRHPCGENGEARVVPVAETIGEVGAVDEVIDEVDVVTKDESVEEFDDANVVAAVDDEDQLLELIRLEFADELALEENVMERGEGGAADNGGVGGETILGGTAVGSVDSGGNKMP